MIRLTTPLNKNDILNLKAGDKVLLSGVIFTARDRAHLFLLKNELKAINGSVIYHCGPVVKREDSGWKVIAAGPTTSARLSAYAPQLIKKYGVRAVIGKGGMDKSVLEALKNNAVYLSAVGGAGAIYANAIQEVKSVRKLNEFGMAEAIWEFKVKDFPLIVTMDARGHSSYEEVYQKAKKVFLNLINA